jgi:hypothetical protein
MNREDREALFMILERNGYRELTKVAEEIRRRGFDAVTNPEEEEDS